jgi:mannan endo-1,4-beta-mannosidase
MKNTTIKVLLLASLVVPAFGVAAPNAYFLRDGVNFQPSYYCNGDMNLGWDLMNEYRKIQFVRIEMDPDGYASVSDFTRWIKEANDSGYQVIATYHKGADIGSPDPSKLMDAANWWKDNYNQLLAGGPFIVNLMNEWGDHSVTSEDYSDAYNQALSVVRTVYSGPVICDIPGWGQSTHIAADASPLINDNNITFSAHIYSDGWNQQTGNWLQTTDLDYLGNANRPVVIGEFGSERSGGADWSALIDHAKSKGWSILGWAWNGDDSPAPMNMISPYWGDNCNATSYTKTSYFDTIYDKLELNCDLTNDGQFNIYDMIAFARNCKRFCTSAHIIKFWRSCRAQ